MAFSIKIFAASFNSADTMTFIPNIPSFIFDQTIGAVQHFFQDSGHIVLSDSLPQFYKMLYKTKGLIGPI